MNRSGPKGKLRSSRLLKPALKRLASPRHLARAVRLSRQRRPDYRAYGDSRLDLLAKVLPGGFLNYGFYPGPLPRPETLSLEDIQLAQRRYAELVAQQVEELEDPVLDVGCGMGGLLRMLVAGGREAIGLTPDAGQVAYLGRHLPDVPILETKFEFLDAASHLGRFGAIITSESLQYLSLHRSLPVMKQILAPRGGWVVFDYFHVSLDVRGSGHPWPEFQRALHDAGLRIESQRDLTDHVLPTLAFIHMWGGKLGLPLVDLLAFDLRRKRPGLHHVFEETLGELRDYAEATVAKCDPDEFRRTRRYRLLTIRHMT